MIVDLATLTCTYVLGLVMGLALAHLLLQLAGWDGALPDALDQLVRTITGKRDDQ